MPLREPRHRVACRRAARTGRERPINGNDAPWASTDRVVGLWYRGAGSLKFYLVTSSGEKTITYYMGSGTSGVSSGNVNIFLGTGARVSAWTRLERNLEQDYEQYSGGISWQEVNGLRISATASPLTTGPPFDEEHTLYLDDISLSDAQTVEHNVLGPGVIGHILRHRTINPTTYAATDKWFGYDQVGSVLHETDDAGALATRHHQDAWGNVMQSYTTGLWNSGASGWHHNTKESDADAGLVYMYQRWYGASTSTFRSMASTGEHAEARYGFARSRSTSLLDIDGKRPTTPTLDQSGGNVFGSLIGFAAKLEEDVRNRRYGNWCGIGWTGGLEDGQIGPGEAPVE